MSPEATETAAAATAAAPPDSPAGTPHDIPGPAPRRRWTRIAQLTAAAALAAVFLAGFVVYHDDAPSNPALAHSAPVTAQDLEALYGVRIGVVGLLAAGGLVELRFQVTDKDKAAVLFGGGDDAPQLAVEKTTKVLKSASGMAHKLTLLDGASYFLLYGNPGNTVHAGMQVAFVLNDVRLEHLVVQR
jgi:hypothetical protein